MQETTADLLLQVLDALVAHTMFCVPRVKALEQVLEGQQLERYEKILEELKGSALASSEVLANLRKALVRDRG
jgi:hypothetical protein